MTWFPRVRKGCASVQPEVEHRFRAVTAASFLLLLYGIVLSAPIVAQDTLVMGVFPRRNFTETIRMYTPMAEYLGRELGLRVELRTTHDFKTFWKGVSERKYDLVHYNQYHYVKSHREQGYNVILKNEEFGRTTIAGAIVVRTDSGIRTLQDLRGKKIVFGGGRQAMQAYILATYLLREAGLSKGDYEEEFALNPPNASLAVFFRLADAGGVGDVVLQLPIVNRKIDVSKMIYLAISDPVAHLPWAVRGDLPVDMRERIRDILAGLGNSGAGQVILKQAKVTRLVPATDPEYDFHRRIIDEVTGEKY